MNVKSILSQIFANIFGVLKGIIALKILTSQGVDNYAILSQYLIFSTLIVQFVIFNYDVPLISNLANNKGAGDAYGSVLMLLLINFIIIFLFVLCTPSIIAELIWSKSIYSGYIKWMFVYSIILSFNHLAQVISNARREFKVTSFLQILQQIFQIIALAIGLAGGSIYFVFAYLIIGELLILIIGLKLVLRPKIDIKITGFKSQWIVENFKVALPLLIGSMMIWIIMNGGRFLVVHLSNLDELSKYAATFSIAILSGLFINPICSVFLPYFSIGEKNEEYSAAKSMIIGSVVLVILTSLASIVLLFFGDFILSKISHSDIYAGDNFLLLICMSQIIYGQVRLLTLYLAVNGNSGSSRTSLIVGGLVFVFVIYPLTFMLQSVGAALAIFIAISTSLLTLKKWIFQIKKIADNFIQQKIINKIWLASIISLVVVAFLKNKIDDNSVFELAFTSIFIIFAYLVVLYCFFNVNIKDLKNNFIKFL